MNKITKIGLICMLCGIGLLIPCFIYQPLETSILLFSILGCLFITLALFIAMFNLDTKETIENNN